MNINDLLYKSAQDGFLFGVEYALGNGANIHAADDCALRWAEQYGHLEVVKYLKQVSEKCSCQCEKKNYCSNCGVKL